MCKLVQALAYIVSQLLIKLLVNSFFYLVYIKTLCSAHSIILFYRSLILQCANIGPADYNYDETISTLRYANRAKNIKNKARINEDPKDALLRQFQKEIEDLKKKLEEGTPHQFQLCHVSVRVALQDVTHWLWSIP